MKNGILGLCFGVCAFVSQDALAESPPFEPESLGQGPYSKMSLLYERTFLGLDILSLEVHFGPEEASQIEEVANGSPFTSSLANSIADVALRAQDVWIRVLFKRNISKNQFLDGARDNTREVYKAGLIEKSFFDEVCQRLNVQFQFMNNRGVLEGDEMLYRVRGDTLHSIYRGADGQVLLDQLDIGEERRRALMGVYFVPKSDFRKGLIQSLFGK
jgi:hypothetical protein